MTTPERVVEHTLSHGGTVRGTPENVALAASIDAQMVDNERAAVAALRDQGVKAAHPDDGWVNRDRNTVRLQYPTFDDGPQVGDLIALGSPWHGYRLVRVTARNEMESQSPIIRASYGLRPGEPWSYSFEPLTESAIERAPHRPWWKRWRG